MFTMCLYKKTKKSEPLIAADIESYISWFFLSENKNGPDLVGEFVHSAS